MIIYPYNSPIILTDAIFTLYGGSLDHTAPAQRQAAYTIAEQALTSDINTFLLPTIVTGTYTFAAKYLNGLPLDYGYIQRVIVTRFIDCEGNIYWSQEGTSNIYVHLRDDTFGVIDLNYLLGNCHCSLPYQIQVVYEAGLPTGTANHANILLALKIYAEIVLNEIVGYGNEAPGDVGILEYANQDYRERRVGLMRTVYGDSAKANFVHKLIGQMGLRTYRHVGL